MPQEHTTPTCWKMYLLPAIVLLVLAVYLPALRHDFVNYDDPAFVLENPAVRSGLTLNGIRWAFTSGHESNWIPLAWISHMLDVQLFGMHPAGHHFVNILFHLFSTVLLFLFLERATGSPWRSAAVSILFALHPMHVESVAWIAERKDVLSCFFGMLTLHAYTVYCQKPVLWRYLAVLLLFCMGLLAKPMLVTLPLVLLLVDWWPLRRLNPQVGRIGRQNSTGALRVFLEKLPFFALSACSSFVTYLVQHQAGTVAQSYLLQARLARAFLSYDTYLFKLFWPSKLAVIYPFSKYPPSSTQILLAALSLLAITAAVIRLRQHRYLATGWLWYIVTLLPVIGLIQIGQHSVADRYTYIPYIGIFIMIAWGVPEALKNRRWKRPALLLLSLASLAPMIVLTSRQLRHWQNSTTLFSHALQVTDDNWIAHNALGLVFYGEGRMDEALHHFDEAIRAKPSYAGAYLNRGLVLRGKEELLPALEAFKNAIIFEPVNQKAHLALGLLYLEMEENELAMKEYRFLAAAGSPFAATLEDELSVK